MAMCQPVVRCSKVDRRVKERAFGTSEASENMKRVPKSEVIEIGLPSGGGIGPRGLIPSNPEFRVFVNALTNVMSVGTKTVHRLEEYRSP